MKRARFLLSFEDISLFSRQLALVLESDLSIQEGLSLIGGKSKDRTIQDISSRMIRDLNEGKNLTRSMEQFREEFGDFFINMVKIGEASGNMCHVLNQVADSFDRQHAAKQKIKSAITYPLILSVLIFAVLMVLVTYIMPMFHGILTSMGGVLPPFTQGIMNFSLFLSRNMVWMILVLLFLIAIPLAYRATPAGKRFFSRLRFLLPIQKEILTTGLAARFARNLSLLVRSGINIMTAMDMIRPVMGNHYLEEKIAKASALLKQGGSFDSALTSLNLFPPILLRLMAVAYGTGHIDKTLDQAADVMDRELDARLERLTTVIEPMLIIFLSVFVGMILLSVILPVTGIINTLG